ncbi:MAG: FtsX-like permease family protein, partial [Oscillospiraceae bacterium]|nr:FtsX-like permease family protein [Oscillospiraceae bacterium]
VTVKERTGEIGLLKALGSQNGVILTEFLLEAAVIALFGGVIGVAAGYALIPAVELTGTRVEAVMSAGVLSLAFALVTGTVFGFYPALKASKLTPIEALSEE